MFKAIALALGLSAAVTVPSVAAPTLNAEDMAVIQRAIDESIQKQVPMIVKETLKHLDRDGGGGASRPPPRVIHVHHRHYPPCCCPPWWGPW